MHMNQISHRDLKPENILLHDKKDLQIKIVDFGFACHIDPGNSLKEFRGTPLYVAPELIEKNYTSKADVWSIGIIAIEMLTGKNPFENN